ncbi:hypothetical protein H181DRAFT_05655 [Streptomyces sp. WMMB 714]|nr:hypothetical protein H181DRAFT_05655 [Streptomyces sp. WMMB 714]
MALDLLKRNNANRPLDRTLVAQLARYMEEGTFQLTHQGIALSGSLKAGEVLDGQHRLSAIVKSGVPTKLLVFEHMSPETMPFLDTGKRRSGGDVLSLTGEKDSTLIASVVRHVHLAKADLTGPWVGSRTRIPNDRLLALFEENPDGYRKSVAVGRPLAKTLGMIPTATSAGYFLGLGSAPEVDTEEWVEGLMTGANLQATDPRLALTKAIVQLRSISSRRRRTDSRAQLGLYLKAWNAWVSGKPIKSLRFQEGEQLPRPVVGQRLA